MIILSKYIIAIIIVIIIGYGLIKKINIYDEFINGVKEGLNISLEIFPTIFALNISVSTFLKSNILNDITKLINIKIIPKEIIPIIFLKSISSSSSLIVLNDILSTYGPDTNIGKIASIITASSDTTIYIIAMYFSIIKIKNTKHSLFVGLLADLISIIISILIIKII